MKNRNFVSKPEIGDRVTLGWRNTNARWLAWWLLILTMVVMVKLIMCMSYE